MCIPFEIVVAFVRMDDQSFDYSVGVAGGDDVGEKGEEGEVGEGRGCVGDWEDEDYAVARVGWHVCEENEC